MLADTFPDETAAAEEQRLINDITADWQSRKKGNNLSDSTAFYYFSSPFFKRNLFTVS